MTWNWLHPDWPNFVFDTSSLRGYEDQFLHNSGLILGSIQHVTEGEKEDLRIQLLSEEAYKSSEIEGEILNRESLQSSIRKHFGLATDNRRIPLAEQGMAEMVVNLYQTYSEPLSQERLNMWHQMLMKGLNDLAVGRYRTHKEPMQIISGPVGHPKIHFEAPPSSKVPSEMIRFLDWFNGSQSENYPILLRSGISHLYFESIHPYEDGNGRIGRALSEKALSQGLKRLTLVSLAQQMALTRKNYYAALRSGSVGLDIQDWLEYFCQTVIAAQESTQKRIEFLIQKTRFYDKHATALNERQTKVIARMFSAGVDGFLGGLNAEKYLAITKTSRATATRDLQALVQMGALTKTGQLRHTRYALNLET
ncbi:MAG: Fic family protein [Acidobacteria bacterium]|nr:Fic family protein [Acidobacteriota bacterium]MCB9398968.1 Fic family protein [Acidobacteriota bacterium]